MGGATLTMSFLVTFKITDDSGFLAIVNADRFDSFIDEQWELPQLLNRFIEEMNKRHLIIWGTGSENEWTVEFLDRSTNKNVFRIYEDHNRYEWAVVFDKL